jgi:two-component system sensor histidine kinase HydH
VLGRTSVDLGISEPGAQADVRARFDRDGCVRDFEYTRRTRSGETRNLILDITPVTLDDTPHALTTVRDVTAQRRAEQQLLEQASLARLGQMLTVITHEVRTPLAGIRMVLQIIGGSLPEGSSERAAADDAIERVDAVAELMHDLLTFARPRALRMSQLDIRPLLERSVEFIRRDPLAADVAIVVDGNSPPVGGDSHQLSRVFLNLLRNAAQAMDGRGRIDIRIRAHDRQCVVSVTDYGPGIPADVRAQLFQPFFTTKKDGTGLGLATVRQIVELHRGSIAVASDPGQGATFEITLPLWQPVDGAPLSSYSIAEREGTGA